MSKARLIITAVIVEGRSQAEVARDYGVSEGWVSKLITRYNTEGEAAFEPRSRRPFTSPNRLPAEVVDLIVEFRNTLTADGLDAGPETISWHLESQHQIRVSPATVWRYLKTAGLIEAQPAKRPKSSYVRFEAAMPNEMWQADFTHWPLADGTDSEILSFLDDRSRFAISVTAHPRVNGVDVVTAFRAAVNVYGPPASTLTDNGMVFTTRYATGKGGRNGFENELARLGITQKNSRPNHPTTVGKVERFQQTLKQWLRAQPPAATINQLQQQLDTFVATYNHQRPHRALERRTPATIYNQLPKATPTTKTNPHYRIRYDIVDKSGAVTIRHSSRLHHIGIGRAHTGTPITIIAADLDIRIIATNTGELLRHLTLDTSRNYQPQNKENP
jgi:transposase InsO family protein